MSRIKQLQEAVLAAKKAYYGGEPSMSDEEYDSLEDELRLISPDNPVLYLTGSVPVRSKEKHSIPMGSQNKVNSAKEYEQWHNKHALGACVGSLKIDGASAAAYYRAGNLVKVITRGDGFIGEDITVNAHYFKNLPLRVPGFSGAVRFEATLKVEDWIKIDPEKRKNPRNLGTGIIMRLNAHQSEYISAICFDIDEEAVQFTSEHDKYKKLQALGFEVVPYSYCESVKDSANYFDFVKQNREHLPYWIDGVVFKIDDIKKQQELGVVGNRPKGQVAWKFDSSGEISTIRGVTVNGGHTGALIPVAQFDPVEIGGTTVTNASLANFEEVARHDIAIGDEVWVIKANDIIPKIVRVVSRVNDRVQIKPPCVCPFCGGAVGKKLTAQNELGSILYCLSESCPKKSFGKIMRYITSLDIQSIGPSILERLIDEFDLKDASDLYTIHEHMDRLTELVINPENGSTRLGAARAKSIIDGINARKIIPLKDFVGSLGVNQLGKRKAEQMILLADGQLDNLADWFSGILNDPVYAAKFGVPNTGKSIHEGLQSVRDMVTKMLQLGVIVPAFIRNANPIFDKAVRTVCFTGVMPSGLSRNEYKSILADYDWHCVDDVSKELTYLVVGDPSAFSKKASKAAKLGINVLSEQEFRTLVGLK